MALENFSFLSSLVKANPSGSDQKATVDNHIRGIKSALLKSFAGFPGAIMVSGVDTGVSNTYVIAPAEPLTEYSLRMTVTFIPANTNGGASTINISGLGAKPIRSVNGAVLNNGDILAGNPLVLVYDGTVFRQTAPTKNYIDQLVTTGAFPVNAGDAGKLLTNNGTSAYFSDTLGVALNEKRGADVPSAPTVNLTTATGNYLHITGSVDINAFTIPDGAARTVVFDNVLTLTNSGGLILPGGANITTAPGDVAILRGEVGASRVVQYTPASGRAVKENTPPGVVLLAVVTPTAVSAIDFLNVFTADYDDYEVIFDAPTVSVVTDIRVGLAKGGVVDSANTYYQSTVSNVQNGSLTYFTTNVGGSGNTPSLTLRFTNVNAAAIGAAHGVDSMAFMLTQGGVNNNIASHQMGAHYNLTAGSVSGFRLFVSTGNFGATGKVRVYGYRKDV